MTNIEKLRELSDRLKALLDDPQPGLFTWHSAVELVMGGIVRFWAGADRERLLSFVRRVADRPCTRAIEPERPCLHCEAKGLIERTVTA